MKNDFCFLQIFEKYYYVNLTKIRPVGGKWFSADRQMDILHNESKSHISQFSEHV